MPKGTQYNNLFDKSSKSTRTIRGVDLIKKELEVLLDFEKYTLFFGNNMGINAESYLYLTNSLASFNLIKSDIEKVFAKYGRARLLKTEMSFNKDTRTLEINLKVAPRQSRKESFSISLLLGEE